MPVHADDDAARLDQLIAGASAALDLPVDPAWQPAVRAHLQMTLGLAAAVAELELPDDAEPAPVFKA